MLFHNVAQPNAPRKYRALNSRGSLPAFLHARRVLRRARRVI